MSDSDHVYKDFRHVLDLPNEKRILFMEEDRWIGYGGAVRMLDRFQSMIDMPRRSRMPNALLVADSNNGKTTIVDRLFRTLGKTSRTEEGESVFPVIVAEAPSSASEKALYLAILHNFLDPHRTTDSTDKLHYQTLHLFRTCNVRMLVIDEFHNLTDGSPIKQRETLNGLRRLCNAAQVAIVGVGTRKAVRVLARDDQYASRFVTWSLPLWKPDREFQTLLNSFETFLPLRRPSKIASRDIARRIHAASQGNLGYMHELLKRCATEAIQTGQEFIDEALVERNTWRKNENGILEHEA